MHIAKLVFDSARAGRLLGSRAVAGEERSLVFAVEGLSIDLVAFDPGGDLQVIHGQIVDTRGEDRGVKARVRLGDHGDVVETDAYGQFAVSAVGALDGMVLQAHTDTLDASCRVPALTTWEACR